MSEHSPCDSVETDAMYPHSPGYEMLVLEGDSDERPVLTMLRRIADANRAEPPDYPTTTTLAEGMGMPVYKAWRTVLALTQGDLIEEVGETWSEGPWQVTHKVELPHVRELLEAIVEKEIVTETTQPIQ